MTKLDNDVDRRIVPVYPWCGGSESNGSAGGGVNDGMSCTEKYTT